MNFLPTESSIWTELEFRLFQKNCPNMSQLLTKLKCPNLSVLSRGIKPCAVICCIRTTEQYIPPFSIFRRTKQNLLLVGLHCDMAVTERGYVNVPTFLEIILYLRRQVQCSGTRQARFSRDLRRCHAKANNIHRLSLPQYSNQKTQLLDKAFLSR